MSEKAKYGISPYGLCPTCGAPGVSTERRMNGDTTCQNGHKHKQSEMIKDKEQVEIEIGKGAKVGNITINKESLLSELSENVNLSKLVNKDHTAVVNAFFANYISSLVMLKLHDLKGLQIIHDHGHSMLTKFSSTMSDLNFWARSMFYSNDHEVKSRMKHDEADILQKWAKRVTHDRIQKMMKVVMTNPEHINWTDVIGSTLMLHHIFDLKSSYFNNVVKTLINWDSTNINSKHKAINDALMFLIQSDPTSKIIPHLRKLENASMISRKSIAQKIVKFGKINEDEGGTVASGDSGTSAANVGSTNAILTADQATQDAVNNMYKMNKMAPKQVSKKAGYTIKNGKMIKKRVKNFSPKKFEAPAFLKPSKQVDGDKNND
jgi:hypothetical protein